MTHVGLVCSSPKEKLLPNIDGVRIVGGKVTLIPIVTSSDTIYETWLVYPQKSTIISDIHHHLSPKWRPCI
jgi:hypothetical protein